MNPEKSFDPHNPEYKKVEDLPLEEQANFVDVKGGFVGKEAFELYEDAEDFSNKSNEERSFLLKLIKRGSVTPIDVLNERALKEEENQALELRINKDISDGTLEESFSKLSLYEKARYLKRAKKIVYSQWSDQKVAGRMSKCLEGIKNLGHEGLLYFEDRSNWRTDQNMLVEGVLDGKNVEFIYNNSGTYEVRVDGVFFHPGYEKAMALFEAYRAFAIDRSDFGFPLREMQNDEDNNLIPENVRAIKAMEIVYSAEKSQQDKIEAEKKKQQDKDRETREATEVEYLLPR